MKRSIFASLFALLFACDPAPEQARRADASVARAPMGLLAFADETRMFAESTTTGVDDAADAPLSTSSSSGDESTSSTGGTDSTSSTDSSTTEPPPAPIYSPYVDCSYPVGHPEMGEAICEGCVGRDELGYGYLYPEYGGPMIPAYCPVPCDPSLGELGGYLCEDFIASIGGVENFGVGTECRSAVVNGPKSCVILCQGQCPIGSKCFVTNTVGHGQVAASNATICMPIPGWVHP